VNLAIVRGRLIREMTRGDLLALHEQITESLPLCSQELNETHAPLLMELEAIEDELESRI
jgi:hypothetical protein